MPLIRNMSRIQPAGSADMVYAGPPAAKPVPSWARFMFLAPTALLFCFPEMPVRFRYLAPLALLSFFFIRNKFKQPVLLWLTIFTAHVIVAGAIVSLFNRGEDFFDSLNVLRPYALSVLVFGALRGLPVRWLIIFATALLGVHALAVAYDVFVAPPWQRMPFPIFDDFALELIARRELVQARYGGFMFEAGAVGGFASLLALGLFSIIYSQWFRGTATKDLWSFIIAALGLVFAIVIFVLARTKSAFFVAGFYMLGVLIGGFLSRTGNVVRRQTMTLLAVVMLSIAGLATYTVARQTAAGAYIEQELDSLRKFMTMGFGSGEGAGLATRMSYMELAGRGILYHPLGVGKTSGESFVKPVEDKIDLTSEMKFFFDLGIFSGYKAFLPNIIMQAGLVGLVCFGYMLKNLMPGRSGLLHEMPEAVWGMRMAFVGAALSVELLPLFEVMVFTALLLEAQQARLQILEISSKSRITAK